MSRRLGRAHDIVSSVNSGTWYEVVRGAAIGCGSVVALQLIAAGYLVLRRRFGWRGTYAVRFHFPPEVHVFFLALVGISIVTMVGYFLPGGAALADTRERIIGALLSLGCAVIVVNFIICLRLRVDDDGITLSTLLRTKRLRWREVRRVRYLPRAFCVVLDGAKGRPSVGISLLLAHSDSLLRVLRARLDRRALRPIAPLYARYTGEALGDDG